MEVFAAQASMAVSDYTMLKAAKILQQQLYSKFPGIVSLAERCQISVSKLKRDFKKVHGVTPLVYFRRYQVSYANGLLAGRDKTLKQLALELGFKKSSTFFAWYKSVNGNDKHLNDQHENAMTLGIIEDDDIYRMILSKVFKRAGFRVLFEASNGKIGIDEILSIPTPPAVIITDLEMPVMDGFEVIRYITAHWPQIKLIAHTSLNDERTHEKVCKAGACVCISKLIGVKGFDELIKTAEALGTPSSKP